MSPERLALAEKVWADRQLKMSYTAIAAKHRTTKGTVAGIIRDITHKRLPVPATPARPPVSPKSPSTPVTLDEAIAFFDRFSSQMLQANPVNLVNTLTIDADRPIAIRFFSCLHLGGRYTNHAEGIRLLREMLSVERGYLVSLGDDLEGYLPGFKDALAQMQQQSLDVQKWAFEELLKELTAKRRLLWGHAGQHSGDWMNRNWGYNPVEQAYRACGAPYYNGLGYIKLQVGAQTYQIASSHVFKGSSMYNPLHALGRAVREMFPMADVAVQGDRHQCAMSEIECYPYEVLMGNRASSRVHLVQVGTAKTGPEPYTTKRFPPGSLGWPILVFSPHKHEVRANWTLDETVKGWLVEKGE